MPGHSRTTSVAWIGHDATPREIGAGANSDAEHSFATGFDLSSRLRQVGRERGAGLLVP